MVKRVTTRTRTYDAGTGAAARTRMVYPWHKLRKPGDWFLWKLARRPGGDRAEINLRVTAHKQRRRRGLILQCTKTHKGLIVTVVGLDL